MEPINSPNSKEAYKQEFQKGVKLFEESLSEYQHSSDFPQKQLMLKDVMDKALDVINQSAKGFLSRKDQPADGLEKDYQAYLNNNTPDTYNKLNQDIERLKGMS